MLPLSVQQRSLRPSALSALLSVLSEGKDIEDIRAMLDREDAMASTERFLLRGTSRRCLKLSSINCEGATCNGRSAASLEEISDGAWKCRGCGVTNSSKRKRCQPPCFKWRPGAYGKKISDSESHDQSRERRDNNDDTHGLGGTIEADVVVVGDEDCTPTGSEEEENEANSTVDVNGELAIVHRTMP